MICFENVSKSFKDLELFKEVNVKFHDGKKIMIKGENGAGKSVFLKMIVGYSTPNFGKIVIDDVELGNEQDFIPNAGVSINAPEFCNQMTGIDNLLYLAKVRNVATEEEIYKLAKLLDFDKDLKKKYKTYSLGMRQKMRIIQALMDNPKYLILDEPFDALDEKGQKKVVKLLNEFMRKDKILIYTSHNLLYEQFADCIYEIKEHKLVEKKLSPSKK